MTYLPKHGDPPEIGSSFFTLLKAIPVHIKKKAPAKDVEKCDDGCA